MAEEKFIGDFTKGTRALKEEAMKLAQHASKLLSDTDTPLIGVTGAEGELGTLLLKMLRSRGHRVRAFRRETGPSLLNCEEEVVWDLTARAGAEDAASGQPPNPLEGCESVIHLAAMPKPWESWQTIYESNLLIDNTLFAAAAGSSSVKRVVYASTNHTQHGASMRSTPETLDSNRFGAHLLGGGGGGLPLMTPNDPPDPDSFYAISKLHGENTGRFYARTRGLTVICLRIGWIVKEPNPLDSPWVSSADNREYMRAMNLSHADASEIFSRAAATPVADLAVPSIGSQGGRFAVCYACSANGRRVFDLSSTEAVLKYRPTSDVEEFFSAANDGGGKTGGEEDAEAGGDDPASKRQKHENDA
jgi:L-arabinose 1-dehydrogenase [NAD(P)+]